MPAQRGPTVGRASRTRRFLTVAVVLMFSAMVVFLATPANRHTTGGVAGGAALRDAREVVAGPFALDVPATPDPATEPVTEPVVTAEPVGQASEQVTGRVVTGAAPTSPAPTPGAGQASPPQAVAVTADMTPPPVTPPTCVEPTPVWTGVACVPGPWNHCPPGQIPAGQDHSGPCVVPVCPDGLIPAEDGTCLPPTYWECPTGTVRAEDGTCVPESFYQCPAGMVRAEDGTCVPESFYTDDQPLAPVVNPDGTPIDQPHPTAG